MTMHTNSGLIITGHQRSGTSLLRGICESHPEITLTNEVGWYRFVDLPLRLHARQILRQWYVKRNSPIRPSANSRGKRFKGFDFGHNLFLTLRYIAYLYALAPSRVTAPAITQALASVFPAPRYVGDKHPDYWFRLDKLVEQQALAIVVIYRDPRDMTSSVLKKSHGDWRNQWGPELRDPTSVAQRWVEMVHTVSRHQEDLYLLSYEELVTNPEKSISDLGSYLDLDPDGFQFSQVTPSSIGNFRRGLTAEELAIVLEITGSTMQRIGYET